MRIASAFVAFLLVASASVSSAQDTDASASTAVALRRLSTVVDSFRTGRVQRVEIVQIPPQLFTRVRVTPDALERDYYYKLTIRDIRRTTYEQGLVVAVASVSATAGKEFPDLRWGVIFFDETEKRVGALYFDAVGTRGAIDSVPVEFKGDMPKWLWENFLPLFK